MPSSPQSVVVCVYVSLLDIYILCSIRLRILLGKCIKLEGIGENDSLFDGYEVSTRTACKFFNADLFRCLSR